MKQTPKGRRNRHEARGATQRTGGIVTLRQAWQRYWDDHGRFVVDPARLEVAWAKVGPALGAELIGPSLYRKTAAYYQRRVSQGVTPATVRREMTAVISAPLRHCLKLGLIGSLPAIFVIAQRPNRRQRVLTDAEIGAIIEASREWPWLFKTVIILAYTAQRIQAVLDLEWDRVEFSAGTLNFNKRLDHLAPRRKGRGYIPMPDELRSYMEQWASAALVNGRFVQPRVVGELPAAFYFHWKRMLKRSGVKNPHEVTPHVMRHSIATKLVREGKDIRLVQQLLGHKSLKTTEDTYVHNSPDMIREGVATLSFSNHQPTKETT